MARGRLPSLPLPPPDYDVTGFSPIHGDFPQVDTASVLLVTNEGSQVGFYFSKSLLQAASPVFSQLHQPQFVDETPERFTLLLRFIDIAGGFWTFHNLSIDDVFNLQELITRYALIPSYRSLLKAIIDQRAIVWTHELRLKSDSQDYRLLVFKLLIVAQELKCVELWNVVLRTDVITLKAVETSLLPQYLDVVISILVVLRTASRISHGRRPLVGYTSDGLMFLFIPGSELTRYYI